MTIKGLNDLKKKYSPNSSLKIPIKDFYGKRIAIDANLWMKKNMSVIRSKIIDRTDFQTSDLNTNLIIKEWFIAAINFIKKWLSNNITPIFVFDGKPREQKLETIKQRQ